MDSEQDLEQPRPAPALPAFTTVIAESWRLYTGNLRTLFGLFALIALVMTLVPTLLVFDVAEGMALPLYLLLAVVLPAVLASIGFGITAIVLWNRARTGLAAEMHPVTVRAAFAGLGTARKELLACALLAGMIDLALAVFLGVLGLLVWALFFGPPILVQVVAVERLSLQEAWPRAGALLKGYTPRVFLYLLAIALGVGLLSAVTLNVLSQLTEGLPNAASYAILSAFQILAVGLTVPLLACASFVCYRSLRTIDQVREEAPSQG